MINNSELVTWTDGLSCGVKVIDDQHKRLVSLVNEMFNNVTGNCTQEQDYFSRISQEAIMYVTNHFSTEEKIMLVTKFPGYAEHKREHDSFVLVFVENIRDYKAGKRFTLSTLTRFLKDWILSHIALLDKQYFEYAVKIFSRNADGGLSIDIKDMSNTRR